MWESRAHEVIDRRSRHPSTVYCSLDDCSIKIVLEYVVVFVLNFQCGL